MEKSLKKQSDMCEGFVLVYFLAVLLYVSCVVGVISRRDCAAYETVIQLRKHEKYLENENYILNEVKCMLKNGTIEDGDYMGYTVEISDTTIYIDITGEYAEKMILVTDSETKEILDIHINR